MKDAVRNLRADKSINILKADNGNTTVVLDRVEYDNKVLALLKVTLQLELNVKYVLSTYLPTYLSLRLKEHKTNCEKAELEKSAVKHSWTNDHRIKWNEASILAIESNKFFRKMGELIEIEKNSTIDQEGKPLDST